MPQADGLRVRDGTDLPQVQSDGLVVLVLGVLQVLQRHRRVFVRGPRRPALQQRHHHLSSLTHLEPKLGVGAVAAAVPTPTCGGALHPSAGELVTVGQQVSCLMDGNNLR